MAMGSSILSLYLLVLSLLTTLYSSSSSSSSSSDDDDNDDDESDCKCRNGLGCNFVLVVGPIREDNGSFGSYELTSF